MTTDQGRAEEALQALARDLIEEISAGRAMERAADPDALELAIFNVRPFGRTETTKAGKVIRETVRGHTSSRTGHISEEEWRAGQAEWKAKGEGIWAAHRWKDIDRGAAAEFARHSGAAHWHLAPHSGRPDLSKGYHELHQAHRVATEKLLPRAETDAQRDSVREGMDHIRSRMQDIDRITGANPARTARLTGSTAERVTRAKEKIAEGEQHPAVQPVVPPMPPPPQGAQAVHPGLGSHIVRLPGDTISGHAHAHAVQPVPAEPPSPEATALGQANRRLEGYAQREEQAREADLRAHLSEVRAGQAEQEGRAAPGTYAPLTDEQYAAHVRHVTDATRQALKEGKSTADQLWFKDGWGPERTAQHKEIIRSFLDRAVDVPSGRQAVLLGGLTGAGKTTVLQQIPEFGPENYFTVSPDDIKAELARRGLAPQIEGLAPMETTPLTHEESLYLADELAWQLMKRGKNIVYDGSMSRPGPVEDRLSWLDEHHYTVHGVFVDVPADLAVQRSESRHRQGMEKYRQGKDELGGRYLDPARIYEQEISPVPGKTSNEHTFDTVRPRFASWQKWDNSGARPRLTEKSGSPESAGGGISSAEELRRQLGPKFQAPFTGATEAQARQAELGSAKEG